MLTTFTFEFRLAVQCCKHLNLEKRGFIISKKRLVLPVVKMKKYLLILLIAIGFSSCDEYAKVQKSSDLDYKLEMAISYYETERYEKAYPLLDELITLYRGTHKQQDVYYYYAMCLYQMKDYILASYHFKTLYQTFPNNEHAEDAAFMTAFCYYLETPKASLDQSYTFKAINEIQFFVNSHPTSQRIEECNMLIDEMREKLEVKSYEIAKVYYRTENYKSAVLAFDHTLSDFPDTPYREEAMFYRLDASYQLAMKSITSLQLQRFKEARTSYNDFLDLYPVSTYKRDAEKIYMKIVIELEKFNVKT